MKHKHWEGPCNQLYVYRWGEYLTLPVRITNSEACEFPSGEYLTPRE